MSEGASILLIDDHPAVREGLAIILQRDQHRVFGEAGSRAELLAWLGQSPADPAQLALLDLSPDEESGFDRIDDLASDVLSERERQVMTMLGVGTRTVETHCERAIEKLGLGGMKELRRRAILDRRVN